MLLNVGEERSVTIFLEQVQYLLSRQDLSYLVKDIEMVILKLLVYFIELLIETKSVLDRIETFSYLPVLHEGRCEA